MIETGHKALQVSLIDDDGNDVIKPIQGSFKISNNDASAPSIGRFVMEFNNVEFKKYGNYSIRIVVEILK